MRMHKLIILLIGSFIFFGEDLAAQDQPDTVIIEEPVPYNEEGDEAGEEGTGDVVTTPDAVHYERLYMDEFKLEALRKKKEFQYKDLDSIAAADSVIFEPRSRTAREDRFKGFDASILIWLIVGVAVVLIILQLAGVNMRQLFAPAKLVQEKDAGALNENIHEIPYESAIQKAILAKNYSLATRLMYLQGLKLLSDKNLIMWHENKTNWQYVYELKNEKLRNSFRTVTHIFEYVQYGHMPLSEEKFTVVQESFRNFKMHVI